MPRKQKAKTHKKLVLTPLHLFCIAVIIILLATLNLIVYFTPGRTTIVHAMDNTPLLQTYYLKNLLSRNPTYRDGWVQLAELEYKLGNNKEAQNAIQKVKEVDPNFKGLDSLQSLLTTK